MTLEVVVCAHCGTPEDENVPGEPCARCNGEFTRIEICTCHVFHFVEAGKIFIGHYRISHSPRCRAHN